MTDNNSQEAPEASPEEQKKLGFRKAHSIFNMLHYEVDYHPRFTPKWKVEFSQGDHPLDIMVNLTLHKFGICMFFLEPYEWFRKSKPYVPPVGADAEG